MMKRVLGSHGIRDPNGSYGCQPKNRGILTPKMDGLFHGKPYEQMDDLGGFPPIFGNTHIYLDFIVFNVALGIFLVIFSADE